MITTYSELVDAKYLNGYKLWLRFADGVQGEIDFSNELDGEIFEPLKDQDYFKSFSIHPVAKVLCWPNGADFSPEFVYNRLKQVA